MNRETQMEELLVFFIIFPVLSEVTSFDHVESWKLVKNRELEPHHQIL